MIIGVVSDTHNNLKNIDIISIFNDMEVPLVVHTGDIAKEVIRKIFRFKL